MIPAWVVNLKGCPTHRVRGPGSRVLAFSHALALLLYNYELSKTVRILECVQNLPWVLFESPPEKWWTTDRRICRDGMYASLIGRRPIKCIRVEKSSSPFDNISLNRRKATTIQNFGRVGMIPFSIRQWTDMSMCHVAGTSSMESFQTL